MRSRPTLIRTSEERGKGRRDTAHRTSRPGRAPPSGSPACPLRRIPAGKAQWRRRVQQLVQAEVHARHRQAHRVPRPPVGPASVSATLGRPGREVVPARCKVIRDQARSEMLVTASSAPPPRARAAGMAWDGASRYRSQPSANADRYRNGGKASSRGSGSGGGVIRLPYPSMRGPASDPALSRTGRPT